MVYLSLGPNNLFVSLLFKMRVSRNNAIWIVPVKHDHSVAVLHSNVILTLRMK